MLFLKLTNGVGKNEFVRKDIIVRVGEGVDANGQPVSNVFTLLNTNIVEVLAVKESASVILEQLEPVSAGIAGAVGQDSQVA